MEQKTTETQVRMQTNLGTITLKLYNETPLHRQLLIFFHFLNNYQD